MAEHKLETHTGTYISYDAPTPDQIDVRDIARSTSMVCRFGGHALRFISIAEHAILVARLVRHELMDGGVPLYGDALLVLAALHHDSHEAYTGDIPSPLKDYIKANAPGVWERLTDKIDEAIAEKIGIPQHFLRAPIIKRADALAMRIEAAHVKSSRGLGEYWGQTEIPPEAYSLNYQPRFLTQDVAEETFLEIHDAYTAIAGR